MGPVPGVASAAEAAPRGVAGATLTPPADPLGERVFNPIVKAEFRRWRARPFTYSSILLATLGSIILLYYMRTGRVAGLAGGLVFFGFDVGGFLSGTAFAPGPGGGPGAGWAFSRAMLAYVIRPSTIIPLLMTWRALASFRSGGMYRAFRMTFLTPGEFLWGIIATPFFASALVLVAYTGLVLAPDLMERSFSRPPDRASISLMLQIGGILLEGASNGILICFVALLVGLLTGARLSALALVAILAIGIQAAQAYPVLDPIWIRDAIEHLPESWRPRLAWTRGLEAYLIWAVPKLLLSAILWQACKFVVRRAASEEEE